MQGRPKIKILLTTTDKALELLGWMAILFIWILTSTQYVNLPDTIPIHYNAAGKADGFGEKWSIVTLPAIATVLFIGLTVLNKFPHVFNYPVSITNNNALQHYTNATRLMRYLKFILVVVFGLIVFKTVETARGEAAGLGPWFLPLILVLVFIPLAYFIRKSFKVKK